MIKKMRLYCSQKTMSVKARLKTRLKTRMNGLWAGFRSTGILNWKILRLSGCRASYNIAFIILIAIVYGCNKDISVSNENKISVEQKESSKPVVNAQNEQTKKIENKQSTPVIKQSKKTTEPDTLKQEIKVTFIELGSVRCIPCKMMQPVMEEIEKEYGNKGVKIVFYDVWTEAGRPYGEQYGIQGIPTQIFLDKDGKEFFRHVGFFPKEEIVKILQNQGIK